MDSIYLLCDTVKKCEPMKVMQEMDITNCNDVYIALIVCIALCIVAIAVSIVVGLWHRRKINSQMKMEIMRHIWSDMERNAVVCASNKAGDKQKNEKFIQYHEKLVRCHEKMLDDLVVAMKDKYVVMNYEEMIKEKNDLLEAYVNVVKEFEDYSAKSKEKSDNNK